MMKENTNLPQKVISVPAILFPLLYGVMYLPIWNGKEFHIDNGISLLLLLFQGVCFVIAITENIFLKKKNNSYPLSCPLMFHSGLLLGFAGIFFVENLFNIPLFPPQH